MDLGGSTASRETWTGKFDGGKEKARPVDGPWRLASDYELISRSSRYARDYPDPKDVAVMRMVVIAAGARHGWQRNRAPNVASMRGGYESCAGMGHARIPGPEADLRSPSFVNKFTML